MATSGPTQLPAFFSTDADFRNWAAGIISALTAVGLTQTADTGQINTGTVLKPAATNTSQGYSIWRFSDALQATLPIFIKVEFGSANIATRPSLWITVGTSTNGAGTIGGQATSRIQALANADKVAGVTLPLFASGATDRIHLATNCDFSSANFTLFWGVERTRDASGVNTGDGYVAFVVGPGTGGARAVPAAGTVPGGTNAGPCVPPNTVGSSLGAGSGEIGVGPGIYFVLGKPFYALVMGMGQGDIAGASTFTATVFGTIHTYVSLSAVGTGLNAINYGSANSHTAAMLWE